MPFTFNLSAPQGVNFTIPQGFEVVDSSGNYSFFTDTAISIPLGLVSGSVTATAEATGTKYNLPAYTLTGITQPLTFLNSVTNLESSNGGTDAETDDQVIARGLTELRIKNPTSASDFEFLAESQLGAGSRCKAIGLLAANRITKELGAIHLFLLNANKEPANTAQIVNIQQFFSDQIPLGSSLYVSPMQLLNVSGDIVAKLVQGRTPDEVADELWEAYQTALDPSQYPIEQDIILSEIEYALRSSAGIKDIQTTTLNGQPLNIPLPNAYTLPYPFSLSISLSTEEGVFYNFLRGAGEPE